MPGEKFNLKNSICDKFQVHILEIVNGLGLAVVLRFTCFFVLSRVKS